MKRSRISALVAAVGIVGGVCSGVAQSASENPYTPFMLSLANPLQVPSAEFDVGGLRLNILYGECQDFDGLDISAVVGRARGHGIGLQAALVANVVDGHGMGIQIGSVNYVKESYEGLQIGAVNYASDNSKAEAQAFQIGVYNGSGYINGCQIGVINFAREMIGIQIGVVNVIQNKDVSFLPIINGYF